MQYNALDRCRCMADKTTDKGAKACDKDADDTKTNLMQLVDIDAPYYLY